MLPRSMLQALALASARGASSSPLAALAATTSASSSAAGAATAAAAAAAAGPARQQLLQASRLLATSSWLAQEQQPHAAQKGGASAGSQQQQGEQQHPGPSGRAESSKGASSSSSSSSSADPRVEELTQKLFQTFRSGYQNVQARMGSAAGGGGGSSGQESQAAALLQEAAREMHAVFKAGGHIRSATRKYTGPVAEGGAGGGEGGGASDLVLTKHKPSAWERLNEKLGEMPGLGGFKKSSAYQKTKEMYEEMREKYENSDHPGVHKIEDIKERLTSGSEASRAMREIRTRDRDFDLNNFVRAIKLDAPVVSKAFLNHDLPTLKLHCGPELIERFSGIFKHFAEAGLFEDPTILFVGDVEVVEIKLLDDDPFAIVQFHCQQLKCTRDKFGNVVDGATDSIQRVYYFWGVQQEKEGVVLPDGQYLPPRWVIRDMMWQSMLALV